MFFSFSLRNYNTTNWWIVDNSSAKQNENLVTLHESIQSHEPLQPIGVLYRDLDSQEPCFLQRILFGICTSFFVFVTL
jgi:hypothetical protein